MNLTLPFILLLLFTTTAIRAQEIIASDSTAKSIGYSPELDKRHGFMGAHFDTPLSTFKDLQFNRTRDGDIVYRKKIERKLIGEATIKYVDYYFYNGKLAGVQVHAVNNLQNEKAWMELLKTAYQVEPDSVLSDSENNLDGTYFWHGEHTFVNYSAYTGSDLSIFVRCLDIRAQKVRDKALRLKRAADKL